MKTLLMAAALITFAPFAAAPALASDDAMLGEARKVAMSIRGVISVRKPL